MTDRREEFFRRAREMARSGEYTGYVDIEIALYGEGFKAANAWLDSHSIRDELDAICERSQKKAADTKPS